MSLCFCFLTKSWATLSFRRVSNTFKIMLSEKHLKTDNVEITKEINLFKVKNHTFKIMSSEKYLISN